MPKLQNLWMQFEYLEEDLENWADSYKTLHEMCEILNELTHEVSERSKMLLLFKDKYE